MSIFLKLVACDETRKAVELFYSVDANRDLQLSVDEVSKWIEKTSALGRKIQTNEILKAYDDNENGRVDLHELKYHTKELDEETREKSGYLLKCKLERTFFQYVIIFLYITCT